MKFTKMQGLGNDYVYVNCLEEELNNPKSIARFVSDRHFGIGSDGLILIKKSEAADFYMDMYNADGSQGLMCGNGIRCVGKYVYDYNLTRKKQLSIETKSGFKYLELYLENGKVANVRVDMGEPFFLPEQIPMRAEGSKVIDRAIIIGQTEYRVTALSMGNPHVVVFVDDIAQIEIEKTGPLFEHSDLFPDRVNTEFIQLLDDKTVAMRVWERGSGETMACGTGACAAAVACSLNGYTKDAVTVKLLGGDLEIQWDRIKNRVYMTGTAQVVFDGEINLENKIE